MEETLTDRICELTDRDYPSWLPGTVVYETRAGSHAYGVDGPDSDLDIVGFCIPPKEVLFPHLRGEVPGFDRQKQRFKKFRAHNVEVPEIYDRGPVDLTMFSIVHYFRQCMENNPNWLETLFTPEEVVETVHPIAKRVRGEAHTFLHKGSAYRFRGLAQSQLSKMRKRDRKPERLYKYGYHAFRGIEEGIQVLEEGTLDVRQYREEMLAIKRGEWAFDEIEEWVEERQDRLNQLYEESDTVPYEPDEDQLKTLLLECLEDYYGSVDECVRFGPWPKSSNSGTNL